MIKRITFITLVILLFVIIGCSQAQDGPVMEVKDPWARSSGGMEMQTHSTPKPGMAQNEAEMGFNSAAYMILDNKGSNPDRLIQARSDVAEAVELHKTEMQGEVMTMQQVEAIDVPAGGQVELKPGGLHIMLIGLKKDLTPGEVIDLVLVFEKAGEIPVKAEVRSP
jgi:copper(I)-binding protein